MILEKENIKIIKFTKRNKNKISRLQNKNMFDSAVAILEKFDVIVCKTNCLLMLEEDSFGVILSDALNVCHSGGMTVPAICLCGGRHSH